MPKYDAVLGYHMNPLTCGVAKFNVQLAERLGVPYLSIANPLTEHINGLLSVKFSELPDDGLRGYASAVLSHDRPPFMVCERPVFYADELGCPSTICGNPTRGAYRVLTFGMAHKIVLPHFEKLKSHLDAEHPDYTVSLSTAIHEGNPWEQSFEDSTTAMRAIFGDKLRVLGFLADDALAKELQECDAVAAYFTPALRANNTSAWAAIAAGKTLYTNLDEQSPDLSNPPTWEGLIAALTKDAAA